MVVEGQHHLRGAVSAMYWKNIRTIPERRIHGIASYDPSHEAGQLSLEAIDWQALDVFYRQALNDGAFRTLGYTFEYLWDYDRTLGELRRLACYHRQIPSLSGESSASRHAHQQ